MRGRLGLDEPMVAEDEADVWMGGGLAYGEGFIAEGNPREKPKLRAGVGNWDDMEALEEPWEDGELVGLVCNLFRTESEE